MTLVGNRGENENFNLQGLTYFIKPEIWLFHVVVLQTTAKKWTKVKTSHAGHVKSLFWPTYCVVHNSSSAKSQTVV